LDCANFDHTAGVPFSELADGITDDDTTYDDDTTDDEAISKACGALLEDQADAPCDGEDKGAYLQCLTDLSQKLLGSESSNDLCFNYRNSYCPILSCYPEGPCRSAAMNYYQCVAEELPKYDPNYDGCNFSCDSHDPLSAGSNLKSGANAVAFS